MSSRIPILALDVDGVIIDGFPRTRWDKNLKEDLGIDPEHFQKEFFTRETLDLILRGKVPSLDPLATFLENYGSRVTASELAAYWHRNDSNVQSPVIEAALEWKSRTGGRLTIATNQEVSRLEYLWSSLGFKSHFDTRIASCEIGVVKPEPAFFQKGDEILGRAPGQVVHFLDDTIVHVEGARAHGWDAHHVESIAHAVEILEGL